MWWVISLALIPLMSVAAFVTTILLMIALNGYPSLPDLLTKLYLAGTFGLILLLSLLPGFLSGKLAQGSKLPLWAGGILTGIPALVLLPILLITLTFTLLAAFGML